MSSTLLTDGFEAQLRQVVTAKRLSGSKMTALTELAVENMQADTEMISLLYRLHKSLPAENKISSLYVFDSIARAAHRQKSKKALVADLNSNIGNAASFLVRLEGMLEGLVGDMLAHGPPEGKEKTRKILDIWTREGTFSLEILTRLTTRVKQGDQSYSQGTPNPPPAINTAVSHTEQPSTSNFTANGIASLPPAILELLGGVVTKPLAEAPPPLVSPVAISPPAPSPQPFTLDPTQLALINQLTAQVAPPPPRSPPSARRFSTDTVNGNFRLQSPRSRSRSRSQSPGRRRNSYFGDRYREGGGRFRDKDRGPPPPPHSARFRDRDGPRRRRSPSPDHSWTGSGRAPLPGAGEAGKDEFGRDVRDDGSDSVHSTPVSAPIPMTQVEPAANPEHAQNTGLAAFNMSGCDFADPNTWTKLAAAWEQTYGRAPTQEELMTIITGGPMDAGPVGSNQWDQSQSQVQAGRGGGRGRGRGRGWQPHAGGGGFRGRGRGRGRGGHGGYGNGGYGEGNALSGDSDAVVLGGDMSGVDYAPYGQTGVEQGYGGSGQDNTVPAATPVSSSGGGMKKIDGKWVWSKN